MENLSHIGAVKAVMARHGFSFSKTLGQNFLINPSVCPRIAEEGGAAPGAGILEIGPGIGVLTHELAKRADKVVAVELDHRLPPILAETLAEHQNVRIVEGDAMKLDLTRLITEEFGGMPVSVCANLPYYITSPLLMTLLESRLPIRAVTVMVQKEAGQRLCAPLGSRESGAVTVAVRYFSEPSILFSVSRGSFLPAPNVDSCVIRLQIRSAPPEGVLDETQFFQVVRGAFSQRRKTMANSLASALHMEKGRVIQALKQAGLPESVRPEQLQMEEFIAAANELLKQGKESC